MQTLEIRQDLISRLIKLDKNYMFLRPAETVNLNWTNLKTGIQKNVNRLKSSTKVYEIVSFFLLTVVGIISFMKVLDLGSWPDLNKGALLILLTVTNSMIAFSQRIKIQRLEKQILLLDILERIDAKQ